MAPGDQPSWSRQAAPARRFTGQSPVVAVPAPSSSPRPGDRARAAMRPRYFNQRTKAAYLGWMHRHREFHGRRDPAPLGEEHVTALLNALASRGHVAASTQHRAAVALLLRYREVLGRDLAWLDELVRATAPARLPVVLTPEEARTILSHVSGPLSFAGEHLGESPEQSRCSL